MPSPTNLQVSRESRGARTPPASSRSKEVSGRNDQADTDLFEIIDRDEDGVLSQAEFERFREGYCDRPDPTHGKLFNLVDTTSNGVITPAEFRQFFISADLDRNGFISR